MDHLDFGSPRAWMACLVTMAVLLASASLPVVDGRPETMLHRKASNRLPAYSVNFTREGLVFNFRSSRENAGDTSVCFGN
jgi:hypothetical protein